MKKFAVVVLCGLAMVVALPVLAQAPQPDPAQQVASQLTPSDPRLQQIVQLVRSGLSESLIAEAIQKETTPYNLTPQDLLYLKENRVPESIIAALLAVEAPSTPGPGRQVPQPVEPAVRAGDAVEGLMLQTGKFRRNRPGTLVFVGDKIEWRDATDASLNAVIFPAGIKKVELECRTASGALFCHELEIDIAKGDTFKFEDVQKSTGGNRNILALRDTFKAKYPRIPIVEKIKK